MFAFSVFIPWWMQKIDWVLPLVLGVIASALSFFKKYSYIFVWVFELIRILMFACILVIAQIFLSFEFCYSLFLICLLIFCFFFQNFHRIHVTLSFSIVLVSIYIALSSGLFNNYYYNIFLIFVSALCYSCFFVLLSYVFNLFNKNWVKQVTVKPKE